MFVQPKEIALKPAKEILKKFNADPKKWLPDAWLTDKKEDADSLPKMYEMNDRLSKKGIIHKNKAGNIKSKITKFANGLA